jgi:hypothetical protein
MIFAIISGVMITLTYVLRILGIFRGKYLPHPLTLIAWIVGNFTSGVYLWAIGETTFSLVNYWSVGLGIISLGFALNQMRHRTKAQRNMWINVDSVNIICLALFVLSLFLYYLLSDVVISASVAFIGSIFGELPMLRKIWTAPETEIYSPLLVAFFRYTIINVLIVNQLGIVESYNSWLWGAVIGVETIVLYLRKQKVLDERKKVVVIRHENALKSIDPYNLSSCNARGENERIMPPNAILEILEN